MGQLGQSFKQSLFPDFTFKNDDAKAIWKAKLNDRDALAIWLPHLSFMAQFAHTTEKLLPNALDFQEAADMAYLVTVRQNHQYGAPSIDSINSILGDVWVHGDKMKRTFSPLPTTTPAASTKAAQPVAPDLSA